MNPKAVVAIRLDPDEIATLTAAANYRGMTVSAWLRTMIRHQNANDTKAGKVKP